MVRSSNQAVATAVAISVVILQLKAKAAAVLGATLAMGRTAREVVSKQSACELGTAEGNECEYETREKPDLLTKFRESLVRWIDDPCPSSCGSSRSGEVGPSIHHFIPLFECHVSSPRKFR